MNSMKKIILSILVFSLVLSGCGKKKTADTSQQATPTTTEMTELVLTEKPYISLIPRQDGHELKLKVTKIPSIIKQIDYELVYTAKSEGSEIEKGVGDTVKNVSSSIEKDLLLGTASCTNGCKYKYDDGVTGGTVTLTLITADNQSATIEAPFSIKSIAQVKKSGTMDLSTENFSTKVTDKSGSFYTLIKNDKVYSLFSNNGLIKDLP